MPGDWWWPAVFAEVGLEQDEPVGVAAAELVAGQLPVAPASRDFVVAAAVVEPVAVFAVAVAGPEAD